MIWSEKYGMWIDPDTRSAERRAKDEAIVQSLEADQERVQSILKAAQEAHDRQAEAIGGIAETVALNLLNQLVEARKKSDLTQVEVARRMNVPPSAVVRLEAGTHSPTLSTLSRYAAAIGMKLEAKRIA
jgi:ribosome-binding protein aMBF1 (putative translation factor)